MPKIDLESIAQTHATGYPDIYAGPVRGRLYRRIAPATGVEDFGISHVVLKPGAWSSQRHWHQGEDELVIMLSGDAVLIDDDGRHAMRSGDVAVFPKGDGNGHHLVNESDGDCVYMAIGRPSATECHYPDIDMHLPAGGPFSRKDGTPYPTK